MTLLHGAGATDVGRVRQINEDRFLVRDDLGLYAVADGVGGHQAGEVASQTSVETLQEAFLEPTTDGLVAAVKAANEAVWRLAQSAAEKRGMGTTLTALALVEENGEEHLAVANVGDSRVYLFQRGDLVQVSEDHSLVGELEREGRLTRDEALVHPQRSIITRALGMDPDIEVDSWQLLPYEGDRLLLCSDGLTNEVPDDRIASTLRRIGDPEEAAHDLVRQARAHGGNDNITVVVVNVVDDDHRAERSSAALAADPARPLSARPTATSVPPVGASDGELEPSPAPTMTATREPRPPTVEARRPRRLTWRVVAFLVVLTLVLGVAVAAVGWYARRTYYVGLDGDQVAVYKGRPGGLLWFKPTLHQRKPLTVHDVLPSRVADLRAGQPEASKADADRYVNRLREEAAEVARRSSTTTTTVAPPPPP
jgi:protein phosphatase